MATYQGEGEIRLWDVATAKEVARLRDTKHLWYDPGTYLLSPDGRYFLDKQACLRNLATGEARFSLPNEHTDFTFAPNSRILASIAPSLRSVHVWDLASGKTIREIKAPEDFEAPVAFSRDSRLLATASHRGTIRIWDIDTGMETVPLPGLEAGSLAGLMNAGRTVLVHRQEGLRFRDLDRPDMAEATRFPRKHSTNSRGG